MFTEIHFVDNQLIFLTSFIPTWTMLSRLKQYLIHLFWDARSDPLHDGNQ